MKRVAVLAVMAALAASFPAWAALDCSRAKANAEKLICSNPRLAQADERMALAFRGAIRRGADPKVLMDTQRTWNHDARDACSEVECMLKAYEQRISDLDSY